MINRLQEIETKTSPPQVSLSIKITRRPKRNYRNQVIIRSLLTLAGDMILDLRKCESFNLIHTVLVVN